MGTMLKPVRWETLPKIMCNPSLNKVKLKVGNISDEKKRFCFVYGIIWPQIWPWKLSACVHELVRSEKERSFVLYTPKKHILFETQREFILNEDASY